MPSIQQIIAEIQLAPDLPQTHKVKVVQIIRDAEQRLKLRSLGKQPRKASGKNLVTLQEWEEVNARLSIVTMQDWIQAHKLCNLMVSDMINEFRSEMVAKGKQYANFKAAFMTYLTKGYLSKPLAACTAEKSPYSNRTTFDSKGVTL